MILELALVAVTSLLFWFCLTRYEKLQQRGKLGVPGPPTSFIWGNMHQLGAYVKKTGPYLHLWQKDVIAAEYGKVYGLYLGSALQVFVHDLDMVKEVLIKQFPNFTNRMVPPSLSSLEEDPIEDVPVAADGVVGCAAVERDLDL